MHVYIAGGDQTNAGFARNGSQLLQAQRVVDFLQ